MDLINFKKAEKIRGKIEDLKEVKGLYSRKPLGQTSLEFLILHYNKIPVFISNPISFLLEDYFIKQLNTRIDELTAEFESL